MVRSAASPETHTPGLGQLDACVGLLYLLPPDEGVLRLALVSGVSRQLSAPWARIPVNAPIPVAHAVREPILVWVSSQEEMARRYPRLGIVLPYDFMLAAAAFLDDGPVQGGMRCSCSGRRADASPGHVGHHQR